MHRAARGLNYLHTGTGIKHGVIHRDVKSSNILLHKTWAAKISDFGLSKIGPTNQQFTHVSTVVKGTFGYLDPDYFSTGRLTRKSDVYAFGVVMFEVLCGKRAADRTLDEDHWGLARWAQESMKEGRLKQIVDVNIRERISPKCLKEFSRLAERCLNSHPKQRPTMAEVMVGLESILVLQEKTSNTLHPASMTIFGRKMPMFLFQSNGVNQAINRSLRSSESLFDSNKGESQKIYRFDFLTISIATEHFSEANKIWQDHSDSMYKGRLQNGQGIAITQPSYSSKFSPQEYINNVLLMGRFENYNLLHLLGYCLERTAIFLVYEFDVFTNMDHFLFDPLMEAYLNWNKRYEVILGVANALNYLHNRAPIRVIHADVRPQNLLFNESLDHRLSYLESARHLAINETDYVIVDRVNVTTGYMAPEYMIEGCLSTKADVFGFGLFILENVSGQRNYLRFSETNENFVQYAWANWLEGTCSNITNPTIDDGSSLISRFINIGLLCVQANAADRPTMDEVVGMFGAPSNTLPLPKNPVSSWMMEEDSNDANGLFDDYDDYNARAVEEFVSELSPR